VAFAGARVEVPLPDLAIVQLHRHNVASQASKNRHADPVVPKSGSCFSINQPLWNRGIVQSISRTVPDQKTRASVESPTVVQLRQQNLKQSELSTNNIQLKQ